MDALDISLSPNILQLYQYWSLQPQSDGPGHFVKGRNELVNLFRTAARVKNHPDVQRDLKESIQRLKNALNLKAGKPGGAMTIVYQYFTHLQS